MMRIVPLIRFGIAGCVIGLAGCANDAGLTTHAVQVQSPVWQPMDTEWWHRFGDPQLDSLVGEALRDAPDMAQARARIEQVRSETELTRARIVQPSFSLDGSAVREEFSSLGYFPPPIGGSVFNLGQVAASFSWDLDWWGKHEAVYQQSAGKLAVAAAEADETRLVLGVSVAEAYFSLQADSASLGFLHDMQRTRNQLLEIDREQEASGLIAAQQVLAEQSALASLDRQIDQMTGQIRKDRLQLAALLGARPERGGQIRETGLPMLLALPDAIPADLIGGRPDIRMAAAQIQVAAATARLAKIDFYPDINLSGNVGLQSIGFDNLLKSGASMFEVGPAIHLPVFNSNSLRAILGARYAEYDMAVQAYNASVFNAMQDVASASVSQGELTSEMQDQLRLEQTLSTTVELAGLRYRHGLEDQKNGLQDQLAEQEARQAQVELARRALGAELSMIRALGGLPKNTTGKDSHEQAK